MATHEGKEDKSKGKQVNTSYTLSDHPSKMSKNKLIGLLKETQIKLENCNDKCIQLEKELKVSKDHISYLMAIAILIAAVKLVTAANNPKKTPNCCGFVW